MIVTYKKNFKISSEDSQRDQRINSKLNLKKLPFKITIDNFCTRYTEMFLDFKPLFQYQSEGQGMKWCFATEKRLKVFLIIFEASQLGKECYKENISNLLTEYSYKTIAQIVDQGVEKNFFMKMVARNFETKDSKIRNIRPSEELVVEFVNWNIELISTFSKFQQKYK